MEGGDESVNTSQPIIVAEMTISSYDTICRETDVPKKGVDLDGAKSGGDDQYLTWLARLEGEKESVEVEVGKLMMECR